MVDVHGFCQDDFAPVREAFAANFDERDDVGASAVVTIDGEAVVDMWAGDASPDGTRWESDTIVNVYSTTKTMAATCVLMLADAGEVDLDAPVAHYWPEFAANSKGGVLLRHVMSHTAGLSGFGEPMTPSDLYDWEKACGVLAAQECWWEPGTAAGYHAVTQGYLQGEVVRRVTGQSIGEFFRTQVAEPLGADFHIGLPAEHEGRVAELIPPGAALFGDADSDPANIALRTGLSTPLDGTEPSTREWRAAEIPAAGGTGNARSVSRVHAALACGGSLDGVSLMSASTVESILAEQWYGTDLVLGMPTRYGMGFGLPSDDMPISPNQTRAFFWGGWGGSIALVDLDARMTVTYVMNKMAPDLLGDVRGAMVVLSAYAALDARD